jgi:hypothetical protein
VAGYPAMLQKARRGAERFFWGMNILRIFDAN